VTVDAVHVWLIGADLPASVLAELEVLLDDDERRRVGALRTEHARRRFVAAHGAARQIAGQWLGTPPERLRWRRGAHGKPELAAPWHGLRVSLSHSGDLALVAVTDRRPIGVDIQELTDRVDAPRLAARYFSDVEARFVAGVDRATRQTVRFARLWVRKEACVKAVGGRLLQGMRLPVANAGTRVLVHDPSGTLPGPFLVHDLPVPRGFRAAVALAGAHPYRIARHRWSAPVP
jgi:4'-phosphopantetheinyl transferase